MVCSNHVRYSSPRLAPFPLSCQRVSSSFASVNNGLCLSVCTRTKGTFTLAETAAISKQHYGESVYLPLSLPLITVVFAPASTAAVPTFPTAVCIHSLRPCICIHSICMAINAVRKRHPAASATAAAGIETDSRPPPPTRDAELGKSGRLRLRFRQRIIIFDNYSAVKRLRIKCSWRLQLPLCLKCSEYVGFSSGSASLPPTASRCDLA